MPQKAFQVYDPKPTIAELDNGFFFEAREQTVHDDPYRADHGRQLVMRQIADQVDTGTTRACRDIEVT